MADVVRHGPAPKPKRGPYLRVLTNSERTSSACDRRWWFAYHLGLTVEASAPLRQGSLVHRLLAAWYQGGMTAGIVSLWQDVGEGWLEERRHHIEARTPAHLRTERHEEDQELALASMGIVDHYIQTHGDHDRENWEIIAVEAQAGRVLPHPVTGKPITDRIAVGGKLTLRTWVHAGQMDLVIRDRRTGLVWAVEHKTTVDTDLEGYCRKLHLDPQIRGYHWLLEDPDPRWSTPALLGLGEVSGVIYNVLRKAVPRVPPLLKPKKEGQPSPGLSKAKIDTTEAVYLDEIQRHGFNPDDYADLLMDLRQKRFFTRDQYPIGPLDTLDWVADHGHWALGRVAASKPTAHHTRQTAMCQGIATPICPFASPCMEDGSWTRSGYATKTIRHEELVGDLSEPHAGLERAAYVIEPPAFIAAAKAAKAAAAKATAAVERAEEQGDPFGSDWAAQPPLEYPSDPDLDSMPDPFAES